MNCKQANENISIKDVLSSFGLSPSKENSRRAFYSAFDRNERTPSLYVNYLKNTAYDYGTGKKYDVVSLVQEIRLCSLSDALEYLKTFDFSSSEAKEQKNRVTNPKPKPNYRILETREIGNPMLTDYLKKRKLEPQKSELLEVHYELDGRKYFGLGFKNDSGGYEIRNPQIKICLEKKDITSIRNGCETIRIFEGFTDYLSFRILENTLEKEPSDYLILNSVSMIQRTSQLLTQYKNIELYLDNDPTGDTATETLKKTHPHATDERILFRNYKDMNEFLQNADLRKKETNRLTPDEPEERTHSRMRR